MTFRLTPWKQWRIVLDTCVLISALRSPRGAAARIVQLLLSGSVINCMDLKVAYEYREVAMRRDQLAVSNRTPEDVDILIVRLEQAAEFVDVTRRHRPLSSDPADDFILDVAINGRVDAIVTNNLKHLLPPAERFGIEVFSPAEFLARLGTER